MLETLLEMRYEACGVILFCIGFAVFCKADALNKARIA